MYTIKTLNGCTHIRNPKGFVRLNRRNVVKAFRDYNVWDSVYQFKTKAQLLQIWDALGVEVED